MTDWDAAVERAQYCRGKLNPILTLVFSEAGRGDSQRHLRDYDY